MAEGIKGKLSFYMTIDDQYQVNLLERAVLSKFYLIESTNTFVPTAFLEFTDLTGEVVDKIDKSRTGSLKFMLGFPKEFLTQNQFTHDHVLFSILNAEQFTGMSTNALTFRLTTWSKIGPRLVDTDFVRSFGDAAASGVIRSLIPQIGADLKAGVIEPGSDQRHYLQAQWTNAQFIRHLAQHAISIEYKTRGFLYFIDREGKLTFSSPRYLYELRKKTPIELVYSNNPVDSTKRDDYVLAWEFDSNSQLFLGHYGYGKTFKRFDGVTYKYLETLKTIKDQIKDVTDSEVTMIDEEKSQTYRSEYTGTRHPNDEVLTTKHASSLIGLNLLLKYREDIKLGSVVKLMIQATDQGEGSQAKRIMLDVLSSYWTVCKITHYVDTISTDYFLKIGLTRVGIASKETTGLVMGVKQ